MVCLSFWSLLLLFGVTYPCSGFLGICRKENLEQRLPTVEEFEGVFQDLPDESDPSYRFLLQVRLWFMSDYLPMAAGNDWYGNETIFLYNHPCSTVTVNGKKEPRVTRVSLMRSRFDGQECLLTVLFACHTFIQDSEAFAFLVYRNCIEKWTHLCPAKLDNPKFTPPVYDKNDESAHKWHMSSYTDSRAGQVKSGGWSPEGLAECDRQRKLVHARRKADSKNHFALYKRLHELLRSSRGITGKAPPLKKKAKRNKKKSAQIVFELGDMSDEDYSVGPDDDDKDKDDDETVLEPGVIAQI